MPIVSMCKRSRALLVKWDSVLFGQAFASCGRDVECYRFFLQCVELDLYTSIPPTRKKPRPDSRSGPRK